MAKNWTKVKDLSRELGITSHRIIKRCRAEGFPVQNSVTRLHPELERSVRTWFAAGDAGKETNSADDNGV